MLTEIVIQHQQKLVVFHRILYGILIVLLALVYAWNPNNATWEYLVILIGTVLIAIAETIMSFVGFFEKLWTLRIMVYIQYSFYLYMLYLTMDNNIYLSLSMFPMIASFMFEFSYFNDITDDLKYIWCIVFLIAPATGVMFSQFLSQGVVIEIFYMMIVFFMMSVFDVLIVRLFYHNEHHLMSQIDILLSDIDEMEEDKNDLINFRNRVEKVNEELNYQRVQLSQMNREIEKANGELSVQSEIMQFINNSMSYRIPQVMEHMINEIMRVQKLDYCGIYIDRNVNYNRKAFYRYEYRVTEFTSDGIQEMKHLYEGASNEEGDKLIVDRISEADYPDFNKHLIKTILVIPLVLDGDKYGILVCGRDKAYDFSAMYRFLDIIVPQINLAVKNIKMYSAMKHMAETDGLTQINNRVHFNRLFADQIDTTVQQQSKLSVALFDIDKFKRINDTYGHLVGDEVIKKIASIAYEQIEEKERGFICRYGGEEFVIALPDMGIEEAMPIVEELHEIIRTTVVEAYDQQVRMNVSIGLTCYPDLCENPQNLLKRADWSMYWAKEHGRGQIKIDGPDIVGDEK